MIEKDGYNMDKTERNYKILSRISAPFLNVIFRPLVLNRSQIASEKPIIYAPNHRKTIDSLVLFANIKDEIHWLALQRFFTGEDSIFANSKNPLLCKLTPVIFNSIGAIPVVREQDAHLYPELIINREMLKRVRTYLAGGSSVGIFPEGTTNKDLTKSEILEAKPTAFSLARKYDAYIQPVSLVYAPKDHPSKYKVIVNFRQAFKMNDLSNEEAVELWSKEMLEGISENNEILENAKNGIKIKLKK